MTTANKAKKATIVYNGIELEAYQLPDGSYHLSKTQVGKAIEKHNDSLREWLSGKSPEALPYKDFSLTELSIEGNNATFHGVPLELAAAYWTYWAQRGNTIALALVSTSVVESLTRLCNTAFGVENNEVAIQQMNVQNVDTNRAIFEMMAMLQAMNDRLEAQENRYQRLDEERAMLAEQNEELEELKEEIESYPQFLYLLDVAKNELDVTDYPNGVTCKQYLEENRIPLDKDHWCTLSRRTASFYRSTKGRSPERRGNHNIYRSIDVAYIVATLRLIMTGKK
ncbi:MAG TPA: hypothetical protein VFM18_08995 [Methanosarcina sp.]|nr:hypothetical protein [Methanosarcina sp.]